MKPTVGRIVHYHAVGIGHGEIFTRAAIITGIGTDGRVNLAVFSDNGTKKGRAETVFRGWVPFSPEPKDCCWSWPPREP